MSSPLILCAFFLVFYYGFADSEIISSGPETVAVRRFSNNFHRPSIRNGSSKFHDNPPIYRFDYGLRDKNHLGQHHNGKNNHRYTTGLYRSYGRGTAIVHKPGATVTVTNSFGKEKAPRGTIAARVIAPLQSYNEPVPQVVTRSRRECTTCPRDKAVVASRGNVHVVLPEPCPTLKWMGITGPKPGSLIPEGSHSLIGRLGHRGKICKYEYEVVVRHCGTFTVKYGNANCTIEDAWGSVCTITCDSGYQLIGSSNMECGDDLKWSTKPPQCKKERGCPLPQTPDNVKIWCQVEDENDLTEDTLPAGTYCRYKSDGKQRFITCVNGYWVNKHGRRKRNHRRVKSRKYNKLDNGNKYGSKVNKKQI